jgi:hypothetical protein
MRLPEAKIKEALAHTDKLVRPEALLYFGHRIALNGPQIVADPRALSSEPEAFRECPTRGLEIENGGRDAAQRHGRRAPGEKASRRAPFCRGRRRYSLLTSSAL